MFPRSIPESWLTLDFMFTNLSREEERKKLLKQQQQQPLPFWSLKKQVTRIHADGGTDCLLVEFGLSLIHI